MTTQLIGMIVMVVGLLAFSYELGAWRCRRRLRRAEPTCGCTHHRAFHDLKTGTCHAPVTRQRWHESGDRQGYDWVRCACQGYVGPEPVNAQVPPALET